MHSLAVQAAVSLAETFQQVVAQDSSAGQLEHAALRPNIRYEQAPAEATGLPAGCADLVTAAQCLHWCGGRVAARGADAVCLKRALWSPACWPQAKRPHLPAACRLDAPAFYRECRRILKPSGALAVFSYIPLGIAFPGSAAATELLRAALLDSNPHFHPRRQRFVLHLFEGEGWCGAVLDCFAGTAGCRAAIGKR